MYTLLNKLVKPLGVSGREEKIRKVIEENIAPYVDEVRVDALGNLIARKRGGEGAKKLMFAAHMDEIGFFVTDIDDDGCVHFSNAGGIHYDAAVFGNVVFENGVKGVLVPKGGVKEPTADDCRVDIGVRTRREAERKVKTGDTFALESGIRRLSGSRVVGRPIDDRIGCAVLIEAAKRMKDSPYDVYFCFTVQEEVGCRGSKTAAYGIMPDISVAVDITGTGDTPGAPRMAVKLGGGAAIKIKDSSVISDPALVGRMEELCRKDGIKHQFEILMRGGTDTSSMQSAGAGSRAGCISIPTRFSHTSVEMVDLSDVEECVKLAVSLIENGAE